MALKREAYKALEGIVGPENISEDPAVLLGYGFAPFCCIYYETGKFTPFPPEAVVLPGNTEEVQGIVRVCSRYKVKFKALGSGWGPWAMAGMPGVITVDMRRMNRIEVDEKNMYAIVEAGVIAGELQAEAMKRGLDNLITGAGASHSIVASAATYYGMGSKTASMSHNSRNVLGVEWVLPTGEILRIGAPGSNVGWFSGDGPGSSLRGIMRGYFGTTGGLGIVTKIGYKLYPWYGPREPEITKENPNYGMSIPENFRFEYVYWDSWQKLTEADYKLSESGIAYYIWRHQPDALGWYITRSNTEFYELFQREALPMLRKHRMGLEIVICGSSGREFEYRNKVFDKILADTGGKVLPLSQEQREILFENAIKVSYLARYCFRPTGDFSSGFGAEEAIGLIPQVTAKGEEVRGKYVEKGLFTNDGPEGFWGGPYEGGRYQHWEQLYWFDPTDYDSRKGGYDYFMDTAQAYLESKGKLGVPMIPHVWGPFADMMGPEFCNVQVWMRKVKNALDPENLSDHSFFISPEPPPPAGPPKSSTR